MRALLPTTITHGGKRIIEEAPSRSHLRDAIYVPNKHDWCGLYDPDGVLVPEAAMFRGPDRHRVMPAPILTDLPSRADALEGRFLYMGPVHPHYGHFLLSTLSRLWPLMNEGLGGRRLLFDSAGGIETRFAKPYFAAIMSALSLGPEDFCFVRQPVWVRDVVVPASSFVELLECHRDFRSLMAFIGAGIVPSARRFAPGARLYLSKGRLNSGVWRFENEVELEDRLQQHGVQIVHPETLDFSDQIALFSNDLHLISTMGSALHSLPFGERPASLVALCRENQIVSNFSMIDDLMGLNTTYLYPPSTERVPSETFETNLRLENVAGVADDLYEASVAASSQ